ncbi:cyclic phosphodiesterase-like [Argentina anserina]|uniref:cyclic phosphodiesterase-like n=1 Tax=Argentina anserina TaxID=57926 RepID=UPI00217647FF|nr:cyclic phosphodiesterase-like [Potentilla anserina]
MPISAEQEALEAQKDALEMHRYAVWGLIPENAYKRVKKVMEALREEFGGPEVEPHISIVGSCLDTEDEAINRFTGACMPHLSLLYGSLTDEEKKRAKEKVLAMDPSITELQYVISRVALYRVNFADRTQKSWVKVREGNLKIN